MSGKELFVLSLMCQVEFGNAYFVGCRHLFDMAMFMANGEFGTLGETVENLPEVVGSKRFVVRKLASDVEIFFTAVHTRFYMENRDFLEVDESRLEELEYGM